jgi:hypothetical protein
MFRNTEINSLYLNGKQEPDHPRVFKERCQVRQ